MIAQGEGGVGRAGEGLPHPPPAVPHRKWGSRHARHRAGTGDRGWGGGGQLLAEWGTIYIGDYLYIYI